MAKPEPNILENYIQELGLDPVKTMNRLTEAGIISDLAILPDDVPDVDAFRAIAFLEGNPL